MRILAIEDDNAIQKLLRIATQNYATEFEVVDRLKEGLELCATQQWDCIIVDLKLMDSTVEETRKELRTIKNLQPNAGLIVCSGMPIPGLKEKCIEAGADTFVAKDQAFTKGMKELIIAINVGMMHVKPDGKPESFMASVRTLQEMAQKTN